MSFKESVKRDNLRVFCNVNEFAELRKLIYDGVEYFGEDGEGVPVVFTKPKLVPRPEIKTRRNFTGFYGEGLHEVNATLHCDIDHLGGVVPEQGHKIYVGESDNFFHAYYIATSALELGMISLELEALDE